ncbi:MULTISPECIES: hypothetical protein [Bacillota]|uniref:Phage protein n=2 Tax=Bacillota TaxID=1239 RepID=Q4L5G8_STAHJ|nr:MULTISPECIES: hypothetical protein [Bacillota]HCZ5923374.1 hypothetical protein [Staphylococcus aureus]MBS5965327.1 hypothetical protein [Finegoldia magna]MBW3856441.1 hypothetical protein [Staphylococcus haemolyticus]MCC3722382.1 hypothetical protein [Staphylococcus haemolyticus]MCH4372971.1 hypothetical protein [Staphylococcus haemolyticus]
MSKIYFDPQQFANAYLSTQEFKPSNYESEQEMLDEAFAVYLMAFEHARKYVEKTQNDG